MQVDTTLKGLCVGVSKTAKGGNMYQVVTTMPNGKAELTNVWTSNEKPLTIKIGDKVDLAVSFSSEIVFIRDTNEKPPTK